MMLSFLAYVVPALAKVHEGTVEKLPMFKPRPWYRADRLDARPVIWSIYHNPQEWEWGESYGRYTIRHKPSQHSFWIANGYGFYRLYDSVGCSCIRTERSFQRFQQGPFGRAFKWWRRNYGAPPQVAEQFASHFVHWPEGHQE